MEQIVTATNRKKVVLSGIQSTGIFTLGNYLGAVRNWGMMQEEFHCAYFVANLHALTVRQDPKTLKQNTLSAYAQLLACGVDPQKSTAFIQSDVYAHTQLAWVLNCCTQFGELSRMTQFKDKSLKNAENINAGLFTYPVLMAADILLYQTDLVPVGADQKQHLELARDIATRFNTLYGKTFVVPQPFIPKTNARVMSLTSPTKKMSKSDDNAKSFIRIIDTPEVILKKVASAVTDSDTVVSYGLGKDGMNNLFNIYCAITNQTIMEVQTQFEGKGYGDFKRCVGQAIAQELTPIREKYDALMKDPSYLLECSQKGAEKATILAQRTLDNVYKKIGI